MNVAIAPQPIGPESLVDGMGCNWGDSLGRRVLRRGGSGQAEVSLHADPSNEGGSMKACGRYQDTPTTSAR